MKASHARLCAAALGVVWLGAVMAAQAPPQRLGIGRPAPPELIASQDTDVRPDGTGLPTGRGTAKEGAGTYARQCASCHGPKGEGGSADVLVGPEPRGVPPFGPEYERWRAGRPDAPFTIGNYWPYATTLFDYVQRAMPLNAPGSLTADETYGIVAWLLAGNGIIPEAAEMNRETLPKVVMPARNMFVPDDRRGGKATR